MVSAGSVSWYKVWRYAGLWALCVSAEHKLDIIWQDRSYCEKLCSESFFFFFLKQLWCSILLHTIPALLPESQTGSGANGPSIFPKKLQAVRTDREKDNSVKKKNTRFFWTRCFWQKRTFWGGWGGDKKNHVQHEGRRKLWWKAWEMSVRGYDLEMNDLFFL